MKIEEVLQIIHQNGVGDAIKCFFISKNISKNDYKSEIINYKYQKGLIKIFMDRFHAQMHEKNLVKSPFCELLIEYNEPKQLITLRLSCKFSKIEDRCIYVKVLNIKYLDDNGEKVSQRILSN